MKRMTRMNATSLSFVSALFAIAIAAGCGSSDDGGSSTDGGAGTSTGGNPSGGTGGSATGGTSSGGTSTGGTSAGGSGGATGGSGGSTDPLDAARQQCIEHINELRATKGRAPYQRWTSAESCADDQATYDSTNGPHAAFIAGNTCNASSQGECPGQGPSSVTGCIDLMWAEKDQSICSGCDQCPSMSDGWAGKCPNCKVTTSNPTCGHYLALVTSSFTQAACGFSSGSPYMAIDYQ